MRLSNHSAILVLFGVVILVCIPSVTYYINDSKKGTSVETAQELIGAVRNYAITENYLPSIEGEGFIFDLNKDVTEYGGNKSNFMKNWDPNYFYIIIVAGKENDLTGDLTYHYFYVSNDSSGNYISLTEENALKKNMFLSSRSMHESERLIDEDMSVTYSFIGEEKEEMDSTLKYGADLKSIHALLDKNNTDDNTGRYITINLKDDSRYGRYDGECESNKKCIKARYIY